MRKNAAINIYGGTMGFFIVETFVFLILRLCEVITWKWIFVFMPLIALAGLIVLLLVEAITLYAIECILEKRDAKRKENKRNE